MSVEEKKTSAWFSALVLAAIVFVFFSLLLFARRFDYDLLIANKAVALAAVTLIGITFLIGPLAKFWPKKWIPRLRLRKQMGLTGFMMAILHAVFSLIMLGNAYYPKMFTDARKLTPESEVSLVLGSIALLIFSVAAITSFNPIKLSMKYHKWKSLQRTGYIAFVMVFFHIFFIKWQGWVDPSNWLNGLPPASLVGASFMVFVLLMRFAVLLSHIGKQNETQYSHVD